MRLIDADALDAEMYHKSFEVDDGRNVWNSGLWIRYKIFEEALRDAPTVDAVPVKHGEWRKTYLDHVAFGERPSIFYCSACCACSNVKTNYCPHCGAEMYEAERREDANI